MQLSLVRPSLIGACPCLSNYVTTRLKFKTQAFCWNRAVVQSFQITLMTSSGWRAISTTCCDITDRGERPAMRHTLKFQGRAEQQRLCGSWFSDLLFNNDRALHPAVAAICRPDASPRCSGETLRDDTVLQYVLGVVNRATEMEMFKHIVVAFLTILFKWCLQEGFNLHNYTLYYLILNTEHRQYSL